MRERTAAEASWQIRFTFRYPDGRTERVRRTMPAGTRKKDAEAYENQLRASLSDGTYNSRKDEEPVQPVSEFADEWLETYCQSHLKPSTIRGYRSAIGQLLPYFEGLRLDQVDAAAVDRYIAGSRGEGLAAKTIQNRLGIFMKMLKTAVEYGKIQEFQLPPSRKIKVATSNVEFLTEEQLAEVLEAAKADPLLHQLIAFAADTGLRAGEIFGLEWDAVRLDGDKPELDVTRSFQRGFVTTPKSGQYRTIPLSAAACRNIRSFKPEGAEPKGPVFVDETGERWKPTRLKNRLPAIGRAIGRDSLGWHIFRHTFGTRLVRKGVALNVVQQLLGHSDIRMTMRYAHVVETDKAAAIALLDG